MKSVLFAASTLAVLSIGANARDDRLPANFVGDWCFAEHTADHLAFHRRGRCADPDLDEWLTINPDSFDVHEMHCQVLVARANRRGDYHAKFRCDDNVIRNYRAVRRSPLRIADEHRAVIMPSNAPSQGLLLERPTSKSRMPD
jgi:hypothetical protein